MVKAGITLEDMSGVIYEVMLGNEHVIIIVTDCFTKNVILVTWEL